MSKPMSPAERYAHLTPRQRDAITTIDKSVLVSAAAGSGKTTVLAERCASLVADQRCPIDELLVVTFTEAAAAEMRSRIASSLKKRLEESSGDGFLREQLYQLESASISTIHAFCRTLIRQWFPQAGIDPQAEILSGPEAILLKRETLDTLFIELYGDGEPLGKQFQVLVDEYGAGNDRAIGEFILRLHDYLASLPNPDEWITQTTVPMSPAQIDEVQHRRLQDELNRHINHAKSIAATINACWPMTDVYVDNLGEHIVQMMTWLKALSTAEPTDWPTIAENIREYSFPRCAQRPRKLSDEDKAQYESAKRLRDDVKKLFERRVRDAICLYTRAELQEGLDRVQPFVETVCALTQRFTERFTAAKSAQSVLDFNDLQRCAYQLLTDARAVNQPSAVAKQLQQQFRYVLVDEFQDIDPLQESILRMISKESAEPPVGNLFTVGDIKQSIYRFRLAEPTLFTEREDLFGQDQPIGEVIRLQENFRSRSSVIEAINTVFTPLMRREFGGSAYDDSAKLNPGATYPESDAVFGTPAVELHILEPVTQQTAAPADEDDEPDDASDEELTGIEREAWLIAGKIDAWMGKGSASAMHVSEKPAAPGTPPGTRPIRFGDIVILLRALPFKAEPIADVLRRRGIPVTIVGQNASIDSTEFRDCLSLLRVLDNRQQDIPLAALLRSPMLGDRYDESDLLTMRLIDREIPFHQAVMRYAAQGDNAALRERLADTLAQLDRYREQMQRAPVAEVLWDILHETGYLAYVGGLSEGNHRREHVLQLHELARQFGQFARQGLRRFLRFLEDMLDQDYSPIAAASASGDDNVVRIMTVHASKGLEFPVVILADAHKSFNLTDTRTPMLIERNLGLCLSVADVERRIMYPTLKKQLAANQMRQDALSEELRVLYVALTRAREHLMVAGRKSLQQIEPYLAMAGVERKVSPIELDSAASPLDWLLTAISVAPKQASPLFKIETYPRTKTDTWAVAQQQSPQQTDSLRQYANLEPMPAAEPCGDTREAEAVVRALDRHYRATELTTLPARVAVTELKRRWDTLADPDERPAVRASVSSTIARPQIVDSSAATRATTHGSQVHRFLQCIDLARPCSESDLTEQLESLITAGVLAGMETDNRQESVRAAAWFFQTDLGTALRTNAAQVQREVPFVASLPPDQYDPAIIGHDERDVLLVRGMVDLLRITDKGLWIVDYKTDRIKADACEARAEQHRFQLQHYATALSAIHGTPVHRLSVVFLHPQRIVDLSNPDSS